MNENDQTGRTAALNRLILRSIVDHAIVTLDDDGIITSWNEGAERVLGWSEEEVVGLSANIFFTEGDSEVGRLQREMRLADEQGRAEDVRWHLKKNGERFWGSGLMMPLLVGSKAEGNAVQNRGKIDGYVKIFRDRTAERDARIRIARLRDRARLAMRHTGSVGVYEYDFSNDIFIADEVCAHLHGLDTETAEKGTSVEALFAGIVEEDRNTCRGALKSSIEVQEELDVTYRVAGHGVKPVWVQTQGSFHAEDGSESVRLIGIVTDITEQHEQLRMQEARLEFADSVRGMSSESEIAGLASRVIGETIYASRVGYGYVEGDGDTLIVEADWNAGGGHGIVGSHRFSDLGDFGPALRNGENVVVEDTGADPRIKGVDCPREMDVGSAANLPLMEGGKLKAVLFVNDDEPRKWTDAELSFLHSMVDRTYAAMDRLKLAREREVLTEELAHRMKNILTLAQVVVKQSLRGVDGLEAERRAIDYRLRALSAAQDLLTRAQEKGADIRAVIEATLAPHLANTDGLDLVGPPLFLASQQVLGLALALHELATNAAKYGAFSTEDGKVMIEWSIDGGAFGFRWTESGGPAVRAPGKPGFGSTLLEKTVGGYFNGDSELHFGEAGVEFIIEGSLI
jgi:PAS domain S-box-containing protein